MGIFRTAGFLALMGLGLSALAGAGGVQEDRIAQARTFIDARNYNEALLLLGTVIREDPERIEQAQALIDEIVRIRQDYNEQYSRLVDQLNESEDDESVLATIAAMESLDANPNRATEIQVRQAKRTLRIRQSNRRFNEILDQAEALLGQDRPAEAVVLYLSGFDLMEAEFEEAAYPDEITQAVRSLRAQVAELGRLSAEALRSEQAAAQDLARALAVGNAQTRSTALNSAAGLWSAASQRLAQIWSGARQLETLNQQVRTVSFDGQGDAHLDYLLPLWRGRARSLGEEGLWGAQAQVWDQGWALWQNTLETRAAALLNQAEAAWTANRLDEARQLWPEILGLARQGAELALLGRARVQSGEGGPVDGAAQAAQVLPAWLRWTSRIRAAERVEAALAFLGDLRALPAGAAVLGREATVQEQLRVRGWRARLEGFLGDSGLGAAAALYPALNPQLVKERLYAGWWQQELDRTWAAETSLVARRAELDHNELDSALTRLETEHQEALSLAAGVPRTLAGSASPVTARFANEALALWSGGQARLGQVGTDLGRILEELQQTPQPLRADGRVPAWIQRVQALQARLTALTGARTQAIAAAQAQAAQALTLRRSAETLLGGIPTLVTQENFDLARTNLDRAGVSGSQSLGLQEDAAFRAFLDQQIAALGQRILEAEDVFVRRDVRQFITQGRDAYLLGRFAQAEEVLLRAEARWAATNATANPEVSLWLNLTRNALSVTTGREISPTDPLFPEMQALLNFARRDFEEARRLLTDGLETEGRARLDRANSTLRKVLIPFPLNQEAAVLNLRILELRDPGAFPEAFRQRYEQAVFKFGADRQTGYLELQDLARINPDFPGMTAQLRRFRIGLGLEAPDNTAQVRTQIAALTTQARTLISQGTEASLEQALSRVNTILQLDPTNTAAANLLSDISSRQRQTVTLSLSSADQQVFQQAVERFTQQRFLEARVLTESLWQTPRNRTFAPLIDLRRRLEARL